MKAQLGDILVQTARVNNEKSLNHRTPQPVIWGDYVFHISGSTNLVAYDLNGLSEIWGYDLDRRIVTSPIVSGNTIFIARTAGTMSALSSE